MYLLWLSQLYLLWKMTRRLPWLWRCLIQRTGCRIISTIDDPLEALGLIADTPLDMVFINMEMKETSFGEEITKTLKSRHIPITLIPGFKTSADGKSKYHDKLRAHTMLTLNALFAPVGQENDPQDCTLRNSIFLKKGHGLQRVSFNKIIYVKAEDDYCEFQTTSGKFVHRVTLNTLLGPSAQKTFFEGSQGVFYPSGSCKQCIAFQK